MKKFAILTISAILAIFAVAPAAAHAEGNETVYPKDEDFIKPLTFTALSDYAVGGDSYAFAEGQEVKVLQGNSLTSYTFAANVVALDIADGVFYCKSEDEAVYSLPYEEGNEKSEHTMPDPILAIDAGDFNYRLTGSALKIANFSDDSISTFEGAYKNMKKYGNEVYAILDNVVYKFTGNERHELDLKFADYGSTAEIFAGVAVSGLKEYSSPSFVTIKEGAHMTEVDLSSFRDGKFITGKTITVTGTVAALLLCVSGNAAVIAVGRDSYILNYENTTPFNVNCYVTPEFGYGKITAAGDKIYASPYVSECTSVLSGAAGRTVKVLNKVQSDMLESAFYEVECDLESGGKLKGYVTEKFLIKTEEVKEDDKKPSEIKDPNYSEDSNTKTIIIVFAVVILVLAAIGVLAYTATAGKFKGKKKGKNKPDEENKE